MNEGIRATICKAKNGKNRWKIISKLLLSFVLLIVMFMIVKVYMQQKWVHSLTVAIQSEDEEKVVKLLNKDFFGFPYDVNSVPSQLFPMNLFAECHESLPIVYACETGNYKVIRALIDSGADVNMHVEGDFMPLEALLLRFGYTENWKEAYLAAELLIDSGADVDYITDDHFSLYELSAQMLPYGEIYSEEMEEIIFRIYRLLYRKGNHGAEFMKKCVEEAVKYDNYKIINYILCKDDSLVDMMTEEEDGLLFAVCREAKNNAWKEGYLKTVDVLVKAGVDLSRCNQDGETAYEYAKRLGLEDIAIIIKP